MGIGRKRRRRGEELGRVAEIVMVLATAGKARGGWAPTAAESALAAEARGALAAAVMGEVELRPRELFPREAVRKLVEDLGLTRARDPAVFGYRPLKASIADRVLLTRRKMEGKDVFAPSATVSKMTASTAKNGFQHGASKVTTGSSKNLSTPIISQVISKQPLLNGTLAGASSVKSPSNPSAVSLPTGSADVKKQIVLNCSDSTQNRGAETIVESNKSGDHTTSSNQSSLQSSCQAEKYVDKNGPAVHPVTSSVVMGYQDPKRELPIQRQSIFSNHKAIAKNVERILHRPANHSSWTVPSTEYMNTRLDCQICKVAIMDMESLLVCDACGRGMHLKCLQYYGNQGLPKTEWYCPTCVAHCKGKPLPPKYGKVTRTIVAPKTCMTGGAQPSHVAAENPTEMGGSGCSSKNLAGNGSVINQNTNKVGSPVCKSATLALDAGSKSPSISGAEPQKENVKYEETSSIEKEGNSVPCGGIPTETATLYNGGRSTRASTYGSGNLSGGSHMLVKSSSANPVNYSNLQSTELSGLKHTDHSFIVSSIETCESTRTPYRHPSENVQSPSTRASTDEIHQADGVTNDGIGKPHKHKIMADDAFSDHDNAHQVTLNGHIYSKHEIVGDRKDRYVGSTASIVDWVGDGLKSIDNKTYYNSCNIDGIIYSLHDHILIATEGNKSSPCKLQSLWEEHDSGSRLAMVNPYFLGSDIPQSISKPCVEEDEVYGSNDERTVLVSTICGPCEVVHVDKFREETKRRCQLDRSGCRLHPIFFCRWNYDESTSSLYKDYNVDNKVGFRHSLFS